MPIPTVSVDDDSIKALVNQFNTTMAEVKRNMTTVESIKSELQWTGAAANGYRGSIDAWIAGVERVHSALQELEARMTTFHGKTTATEDDNTTAARF